MERQFHIRRSCNCWSIFAATRMLSHWLNSRTEMDYDYENKTFSKYGSGRMPNDFYRRRRLCNSAGDDCGPVSQSHSRCLPENKQQRLDPRTEGLACCIWRHGENGRQVACGDSVRRQEPRESA